MNKTWPIASALTGNLIQTRGAAHAGSVYLTFDDGPHPEHSAHLLEVLKEHAAKGTFFLIGKAIEKHPQLAKKMLSQGHAIGNHSMNHPKMRRLSMRQQWVEINQGNSALERIDGLKKHSFRPPNGRVTLPILLHSLWHKQPLVLWSIDSLDYSLDSQGVVKRLQTQPPQAGDVILFHDDGHCAAQALAILLPEWKKMGLQFPALS
jgi:peptidoglycan-N-acetylglucosamine deacetylase